MNLKGNHYDETSGEADPKKLSEKGNINLKISDKEEKMDSGYDECICFK